MKNNNDTIVSGLAVSTRSLFLGAVVVLSQMWSLFFTPWAWDQQSRHRSPHPMHLLADHSYHMYLASLTSVSLLKLSC